MNLANLFKPDSSDIPVEPGIVPALAHWTQIKLDGERRTLPLIITSEQDERLKECKFRVFARMEIAGMLTYVPVYAGADMPINSDFQSQIRRAAERMEPLGFTLAFR